MKKGFTLVELLAVIVILGVIIGISFPIVNHTIKNSKNKALEESKNNIIEAAKKFSVLHDIGYDETYQKLDLQTLKKEGLIDNKLINPVDKTEMKGCIVYKWDNKYKQYEFKYEEPCTIKSLIDILLEQYQGKISSDVNAYGLVKDVKNPNIYYFRGGPNQVQNNFLWYGGHHWRILEFDKEKKTIKLITSQPIVSTSFNETVWNNAEDYNKSYVNKWLNGIGDGSVTDGYFYRNLNDNIKKNIVPSEFKIIIPEHEKNPSDNPIITVNNKIGLLDSLDYQKTIIDEFTFLNYDCSWWLGNKYDNNSIRIINSFNHLYNLDSNCLSTLRPVMTIKDINIINGNGSIEDNYESIYIEKNPTKLNSGEYVKLNMNSNRFCKNGNCLFRVVENQDGIIKLILNGMILETSQFGHKLFDIGFAVNKDTQSNTMYKEKLYPFLNDININNNVFYNGKFYIGDNYKFYHHFFETGFLNDRIGVPVVGEMFSTNDVNLSSPYLVNKKIIEGNGSINSFWLLNSNFEDQLIINEFSEIENVSASDASSYGVRPVIYIDGNKVTFDSGNGSPNNPFVLVSK